MRKIYSFLRNTGSGTCYNPGVMPLRISYQITCFFPSATEYSARLLAGAMRYVDELCAAPSGPFRQKVPAPATGPCSSIFRIPSSASLPRIRFLCDTSANCNTPAKQSKPIKQTTDFTDKGPRITRIRLQECQPTRTLSQEDILEQEATEPCFSVASVLSCSIFLRRESLQPPVVTVMHYP